MPVGPQRTLGPVAHRILVALVLGVVVVAAVLTLILGFAPWLLLGAFWLAGTALLAPRFGWSLATAFVVIGELFVAQWTMVANPLLGVRLDVTAIVAMTAVLAVTAVVVLRRSPTGAVFPPVRVVDTLAALLPALLSASLIVVADLVRGSAAVTWAMAGDAQLNTVLARMIAADGGANAVNSNVISLAQGLMAMVHLPGREAVAAGDLLTHDIVRQAELWIVLVLVASVLGGAIAAHVVRRSGAVVRTVTILGAAAIPLSWHLTGYAMTAGFYNTDLAYLALELVVLVAIALRRSPWLRVSALLVLGTVLLGAWTPLAIVPLVLAAGAGVAALRTRPRGREVAVVALAAAQLVAFGALFIVPSFLRTGAELSQPGTIVPIPLPLVVVAIAGLLALSSVLLGRARSTDRTLAATSLLVLGGTVAGLAVLVVQNRHLDQPWIYYPIKFGWITLEVLFLLAWVSVAALVRRVAVRRLSLGLVALLSTGVVIVGLSMLNPPRYGGVLSYLPLVQIAVDPPESEDALPVLSAHAGERVAYSHFLGADDAFMNQWQFQLSIDTADDPIRSFAYRVVETPQDFCDAAAAWGGDVEVITADAAWATRLDAQCGQLLDAVVQEAPLD